MLSGEDEALLIWGDTFLVLNLSLDVLNSVGGFDVQSDGLASESLDEDLHTSTKSEDQVKSGLLLDVVVRKSTAVFKLLSSEDEALLIWGDAFLVLDFSLDILNGVGWFDVQSDCLASESLNEDLHATSEAENQMEG